MSKIKILIVEDEGIIADNIADALEDFGYDPIDIAINYTEAIRCIEEEQPDLAILDIQLSGKKTGIDIGATIQKNYNFPFIFLTANSDRDTFSEARKVEPSAFLAKPFIKDELYAAIDLALYNFSKQQERYIDETNLIIKDALFIKQKQMFIRLNFSDILYLKSDNVYIEIYTTKNTKYLVRSTLNDYMDKLSDSFQRVHRSYIVNTIHLTGINHLIVQLLDKIEIPLSKNYREDLLTLVNKG